MRYRGKILINYLTQPFFGVRLSSSVYFIGGLALVVYTPPLTFWIVSVYSMLKHYYDTYNICKFSKYSLFNY